MLLLILSRMLTVDYKLEFWFSLSRCCTLNQAKHGKPNLNIKFKFWTKQLTVNQKYFGIKLYFNIFIFEFSFQQTHHDFSKLQDKCLHGYLPKTGNTKSLFWMLQFEKSSMSVPGPGQPGWWFYDLNLTINIFLGGPCFFYSLVAFLLPNPGKCTSLKVYLSSDWTENNWFFAWYIIISLLTIIYSS